MIIYTYGIAITLLLYALDGEVKNYSDVRAVFIVALAWPVFAVGIIAFLLVVFYLIVCDLLRVEA